MSKKYYLPHIQWGTRPENALPLAGGAGWFAGAWQLSRESAPIYTLPPDIPPDICARLTAPRLLPGVSADDAPLIMGIVNVTPDSFSDGGQYHESAAGAAHGVVLAQEGADLLDIGGESTRPGAKLVSADEECARVIPVLDLLKDKTNVPLSVDTRKSSVAAAALKAGAVIINDVSALSFDPALVETAAQSGAFLCLMHAQGTPEDMQDKPQYENVLFDVYDMLAERIAYAVKAGVAREKIIVDPGIGFGKTIAHNLALIRDIGLFHGLGCPILLGASRKSFIGQISGETQAKARLGGSIAAALTALAQGVQIIRTHDVQQTCQARDIWKALHVAPERISS